MDLAPVDQDVLALVFAPMPEVRQVSGDVPIVQSRGRGVGCRVEFEMRILEGVFGRASCGHGRPSGGEVTGPGQHPPFYDDPGAETSETGGHSPCMDPLEAG